MGGSTESQFPPPPNPFQAPRQAVRSPPPSLTEIKASPSELYLDLIPQGPEDQWNLSMGRFMHETRKEYRFRLVANPAYKSTTSTLQCTVMAKNFARSVTKALPCKCKFIEKSARPIAYRMIEESKARLGSTCSQIVWSDRTSMTRSGDTLPKTRS